MHQAHKVVIRSYITIIIMFQLKVKITQWVTHIITFNTPHLNPPPHIQVRKTLLNILNTVTVEILMTVFTEGKKSQSTDVGITPDMTLLRQKCVNYVVKVVNYGKVHDENEHCIRSQYRCTDNNGRVPCPALEMENTLFGPSVVFVQPEQTQ